MGGNVRDETGLDAARARRPVSVGVAARGLGLGVEGRAVEKKPAREVDPKSDLGNRMITVRVGRLDSGEREEALAKGMSQAGRLYESGIIKGCLMEVQGARGLIDPGDLLQPG